MPSQNTPPHHGLPTLDDLRPRTVTDQIFEELYKRVIDLSLPPGTRLSEAEVAAKMGVSRQPVRDAFYRLSQQGFIEIRPQRATIVTAISEESILQAQFIRLALETACLRRATERLTADHLAALDRLVERQDATVKADQRAEFHALDDQFHHDICAYTGLEFAWTLIKENKGHMDRARYLSLSFGAPKALAEHREIMAALHARDADRAVAACERHLGRIAEIFPRLRADNPDAFGKRQEAES
ncbi:GntR family transcriptional regulator [Paracoccus saliphilus]|nr:GntR family transcriptional regulator [Paracoccus saliphilus]WCR04501.1 GntR family transcriptional regulator [Paracoccus saliphilus]